MIYILTLICAGSIPVAECNTRTARAYRADVEHGVVCGLPSQNTFTQSPLAPSEKEYMLIQCKKR